MSESAETPTKPGFYWAKWKIAENGALDGTMPYGKDWEVVDVWENYTGPDDGIIEKLLVHVPGVSQGQSLDCFFWGPGPLKPPVNGATP